MATIETIFKIAAGVSGGNAVKALGDNLKGVNSTANNLKRSFSQAAIGLKAFAGALAFRELSNFIMGAVNAADHLNDLRQRTGVAVETLAKFKIAADTSGVSIDEVASAIQKLNKNMVAAQQGTGAQAAAFRAIGISAKEIKALNPEQTFLKIADAFSKTNDGAAKSAVAMELFGKSGASLIPLLNQGAEEIKKFDSAITGDFAAKADKLNDEIAILKNNIQNMAVYLAGELVPSLTKATEGLNENSNGMKTLVAMVKGLQLAFIGLGTAWSTITNGIGRELALMANEFSGTVEQLKLLASFDFTGAKAMAKVKNANSDAIKAESDRQMNELLANAQRRVALLTGIEKEIAQKTDSPKPTEKGNIGFNPTGSANAEAAAKAMDAWLVKQRESVETLRLEGTYIGKTAIEIDRLRDARKLDAEFAQKIKDLSPAQVEAYRNQTDEIKKQRDAQIKLNYERSRTFGAGAQSAFNEYLDSVGNVAEQSKQLFTNAFNGIEDVLTKFVETGKLSFRGLAQSIIADLIKIQVRKNITNQLSSLFDGGKALSSLGSFFGFANGGIMSSAGKMPLNKYANGGIANKPQLAMFGEGRLPEAYVPLPDGKRIPVSLQNAGGGGSTKIDVVVYADGNSNVSADNGQGSALGTLIASSIKATLINEKRPGGLLAA